jgi:NAD(P)-dependent dehydrogenase (short-subunit alcohol dehydrogenase family)
MRVIAVLNNGIFTGGAQGIGASTVTQLYQSGAHVFFGDWDETKGTKLVSELQASQSSSDGSVTYLKVNIREYQSLLSLFDTAYDKHGRIDMAICCAAVTERPGYWEPEKLDLKSVREVCLSRWRGWLPSNPASSLSSWDAEQY